MTVREPALKAARELQFAAFQGCFGSSAIEPSDLDFFVEHRGRFLFIEGKGRTLAIESGQRRALQALSRLPGVTVLVIGGDDPNAPTVMQRYLDGAPQPTRACTLEDVRAFVARWFGGGT